MKRMGIFVFFDSQGIVAPYAAFLLESLQKDLDMLFIVVNGNLQAQERKKLSRYTRYIFQRENIGYDGGAYKDVFTKLVKRQFWEQWDEILLMNDTFYGPFYPWTKVFERMQGCDCDFWGLSSHPGGKVDLLGETVPAHVQSYFILVKRRMFLHPSFWAFWDRLRYPESYIEAIRRFEIYFTEYFTEKGFRRSSYAQVSVMQKGLCGEPDIYDVETWIRDLQFPVLKRKYYLLHHYIALHHVFRYLEENSEYPLRVIEEDVCRRSREGRIGPYNPEKIREFCAAHQRIYVFGMGNHAKNITCFLEDNGVKVSGYIVSDNDGTGKSLSLQELQAGSGDGIIVALGENNFAQVYGKLKDRVSEKHLLVPGYEGEV